MMETLFSKPPPRISFLSLLKLKIPAALRIEKEIELSATCFVVGSVAPTRLMLGATPLDLVANTGSHT